MFHLDRLFKSAVVLLLVYAGLWLITWRVGPWVLRRQLLIEAKKEWAHEIQLQQDREVADPRQKGFDDFAFTRGPSVQVRLLRCSAPFVFEAEVSRSIGGLNGSGAIGRYVFTPWHVYVVWKKQAWLS